MYYDEDDWDGDWWYDESYDWSKDWSWYDDSSWHAPDWTPEVQQLALPPPQQTMTTQAPIVSQPQTAAAVIASPPGLTSSDQIANESLIASSSSSNSRGSGTARSARPGIASKLFVGALMLIGTLSTNVPVLPVYIPVSAPTYSEAPLQNTQTLHKDSDIVPEDSFGTDQDRLASFHTKSGIVDGTWILFDSGASANCCRPPWFAQDYPLLPVGSDCPVLRSISGKTLDIIGKRVVELDCGGHSLCVHFYVCKSIPFPLVSVTRFLLQDFVTVMSRTFMTLLTPDCQTVPIVRRGTLVYRPISGL